MRRPIVELSRTFRFEAAHYLPRLPEGHKCRRVHGHSYAVEVVVRGPVDPDTGFFVDYADISEAFRPLRTALDHRLLNEIEGLENPTSENLARWLWQRLCGAVRGLHAITIAETCTSKCTYRGEEVELP